MIKHIVLFNLKPEYKNDDEFKIAKLVAARLESLPHKIDEISFLEVGTNFSERQSAYDLVLITQFETKEDLEAYRKHPDHVAVVEEIKQYTLSTAICDYESLTKLGYVN